jgi:hypothetical protein
MSLRKVYREKWWQFAERQSSLYRDIEYLKRVLVVAQVSKTLAFSFVDKNIVLDGKLIVFVLEKGFYLSILQSSFHFLWAWKYCTTMKADLSYTPTAIFETFPFPVSLEPNNVDPSNSCMTQLDELGERLDSSRREIMLKLDIGLTKLYNLYHTKDVSQENAMSVAGCTDPDGAWAIEKIYALRALQKEIDETVRNAYGWEDLPLHHGFYELEFLPENDRIRYTVSNEARRTILERLLALNHQRHQEEFAAGLVDEKGRPLKKKAKKGKAAGEAELF